MILRIIRSTLKITYVVLKLEAGVTVYKSTLYRLLKEEGITN
jgi:transposase